MSFRWECVVEIARKKGDEYVCCGSGTLIAKGRVLTAKHVVMRGEHARPDLFVRLDKQPYVSASIGWFGEDDLDVALLVAELSLDRIESPLLLLSDRDIQAGESWEAKGFPEVTKENPSHDSRKYGDKTQSWTQTEPFLILKEFANPDSWAGLSGAAIVIGKHIVGVMRSYEHGHDNKRLRATPVHAFLKNPEFRAALGITEHDEILARDLEALEIEITHELQEAFELCKALADRLGCNKSARDVAHTLVHTRACDLATMLVDLDILVVKERHRVRHLLWRTLPLSVDWHAVLLTTRRAVADGGHAVEFPMNTETIAEIILAGVDGRSCDFVLDEGDPRGAARVGLPPEAYSPMFFMSNEGGDRLVDAVVGHWFCEQEPVIKSFPGRKAPTPDDPKVRVWIRKKFADLARQDNPKRLPHYVIFRDEEWRQFRSGSMDALWQVACEAFKKEIPSLRLVRLRGGDQEFEEEADVIVQIQKYLEQRGMKA